jgi:hypothetical protein
MPEPGQMAAIPVGYPVDRPPVKAAAKGTKKHPVAPASKTSAGAAPAKKPVAQGTKKAPTRKVSTSMQHPGA